MKFLYQPVTPWRVTQPFAANMACSNPDFSGVVWANPDGTCPAGKVKLYEALGTAGHTGVDLALRRWQPIYASAPGKVIKVYTIVQKGLGVSVRTDDKYFCTETGKDEYFRYLNFHMISLDVEVGDHVEIGDLLGYGDSTGISGGDHDHYELAPVDENGNTILNNQYWGCVDPLPYMYPHFALKYSLLKQYAELLARYVDLLADKLRRK